jgi:hypothetical protein
MRTNGRESRRFRPRLNPLESRRLLSVPTLSFVQQAGDYVNEQGQWPPAPDGFQDLEFKISGLSQSQSTITEIDLKSILNNAGSWEWLPGSSSNTAYVTTDPNDPTAVDMYVSFVQQLTGSVAYSVTVKYGATADNNPLQYVSYPSAPNPPVDPTLRDPAYQLKATVVGQGGDPSPLPLQGAQDFEGSGAAPGADGVKDVHLDLTNFPESSLYDLLIIANPNTPNTAPTYWQAGTYNYTNTPTGAIC